MLNQLTIFLLSFGVFQTVLIIFFLLRNRAKYPNPFLIFFLVAIGLQLAFKVMTKGWLWLNAGVTLYNISYSLPFLIGPSLYFLVRSRNGSSTFKVADFYHFLPFLLNVVLTMSRSSFRGNFLYWLSADLPRAFFQLILLFAYGIVSWRLLHSMDKKTNQLRQLILSIVSVETIIIITIALMVRFNGSFPDVRLLFIVLTLFIYWMSYMLISRQEPFISAEIKRTSKYERSGLKSSEAERIVQQLQEIMHHQKIFLDPDLTAEVLAQKLNTTKHHLSQAINEHFTKSYFDYLNSLRLEEAYARLANPKFSHHTIAAIAFDSGFKSLSAFNDIFKKRYQQTPSKFREQNLKTITA